jgi:phosphonate transport system substrate-binding protein
VLSSARVSSRLANVRSASERGFLAAPVATLLTLVVIAGVTWFALQNERDAAERTRERAQVETQVLDVLTGRLSDTEGRPMRPVSGWGSPEQPIRLTFVPSGDQAQARTAIDGLVEWLRERTGYAVEGATLRNYGLVVTQIATGECEVAFLTAVSYMRARFLTDASESEDDDIEAVLSAVREPHPDYPKSDLSYRAALVVRTDSDLERIEQLGPGRTVAMGSVLSGAGSILPAALFNELGLEPRIVRFPGGYPFIVDAVISGKVDAGCIYWSPPTAERPRNDARVQIENTIPDVFERTRILGFTRWIPNEPVVMRKSLPDELKLTLARAIDLYVSTKALTPEGRLELTSIGSVVGYVPATNGRYEALEEAVERAFANDPEGLADFKRGAR